MAELEELARLMMSDELNKAIEAENPYRGFESVTDQISPLLMKAYQGQDPQYRDPKELLGAALATGLLGGVFKGYGDEYQNTLKDRYRQSVFNVMTGGSPDVEDMPEALKSKARDMAALKLAMEYEKKRELAKLMGLQKAEREDASKIRIKEMEAEAFLRDPEAARESLAAYREFLAGGTPKSEPRLEKSENSSAEKVSPATSKYGIKPIQERRKELLEKAYEDARGMGLSKTQAAIEARESTKAALGAEVESEKKGFDKIEALREQAKNMLNMSDTVDQALGAGLKTGKMDQYLWYGTPEQDMLKSIKPDIVKMKRVPGNTTDFDAKMYLMGGASEDKQEETNKEISRRMRELAERDLDRANFLDEIRAGGGTVAQADNLWAKYERANPLWVKKGKALIPNRDRVPYSQFDFTGSVEPPQPPSTTSGVDIPSLTAKIRRKRFDLLNQDEINYVEQMRPGLLDRYLSE
jgi:hypothetical protein